jgi:hypothetical protein
MQLCRVNAMATLYCAAMSIDGFLADVNNSLDWLFQFKTETNTYVSFMANVGALAMGATTYQWLLDHQVNGPEPTPWPYDMPTWVFTHRRIDAPVGADIRFVQGPVLPVHDQMLAAAGGRDVWWAAADGAAAAADIGRAVWRRLCRVALRRGLFVVGLVRSLEHGESATSCAP